MASAEALLPELQVVAPRLNLTPPPNAAIAASEAANEATYRTTLARGGLAADVAGVVGRALGVLTLIFTPGNTGPDRTGELNEPLREPTPVDSAPTGSPDAPVGNPGDVPAPEVLPEIVISPGPRPFNPPSVPTPGVFPDPFGLPVDLPFGVPGAFPLPSGQPRSLPRSTPERSPDIVARPDLRPLGDPLADPFALPRPNLEPVPRPAPEPAPSPKPRAEPRSPTSPLALPFDPLRPFEYEVFREPRDVTSDVINRVTAPLTDAQAQPDEAEDPCDCGGKKKRKKKKDKKPPRSICYQGTYTQRSRGITYARKRQVPCTSGPITTPAPKSSRIPKNLGDLVGDVFSFPRS